MTRHLTLATAAALLLGGGVELARSDGTTGAAVLAAGLITLGAWLAGEARRNNNDDGP